MATAFITIQALPVTIYSRVLILLVSTPQLMAQDSDCLSHVALYIPFNTWKSYMVAGRMISGIDLLNREPVVKVDDPSQRMPT